MPYTRAIKSAISFTPPTSSLPPHLPVKIHHLHILSRHLDLSNTFNASVWAIATVAFWCQCRLNELCIETSFNPTLHASRAACRKHGFASNGIEYRGFFVPSMKTKPKGDWICWTDSSCECSTLTAFKNHCNLDAAILTVTHLFAFETEDSSWAPMKHQTDPTVCLRSGVSAQSESRM